MRDTTDENQTRWKTRYNPRTPYPSTPRRQAFHRPRTSLGVAGHWLHLATVAAPLIIAEVIKDPDAKWRAMKLVTVGSAIASEALWTHRLMKDRRKDKEVEAALENCAQR